MIGNFNAAQNILVEGRRTAGSAGLARGVSDLQVAHSEARNT